MANKEVERFTCKANSFSFEIYELRLHVQIEFQTTHGMVFLSFQALNKCSCWKTIASISTAPFAFRYSEYDKVKVSSPSFQAELLHLSGQAGLTGKGCESSPALPSRLSPVPAPRFQTWTGQVSRLLIFIFLLTREKGAGEKRTQRLESKYRFSACDCICA